MRFRLVQPRSNSDACPLGRWGDPETTALKSLSIARSEKTLFIFGLTYCEGPQYLFNYSQNNQAQYGILAEASAQAQSIGTLFEQIGLRGGSVDMSKSQRHTRSGAGRGVSQANEAAISPKFTGLCQHEIVSEEMEAMWDCASHFWVLGRSRVHGRPHLSFCPITLKHFNSRPW